MNRERKGKDMCALIVSNQSEISSLLALGPCGQTTEKNFAQTSALLPMPGEKVI